MEPEITIYSDASLKAWGAYCDGISAQGPWTKAEETLHINQLELLAAFNALRAFVHKTNISVRLCLDNSTAVAYVNNGGGTRSKALCKIARELLAWCEERNVSVLAEHLPGENNTLADEASRFLKDSSDWRLKPILFNKIDKIWPAELDFFALSWNAQLPSFVSWGPQPGAKAIIALSVDWAETNAYLFPPFSIISRCLTEMRKERATVTLVCPVWPGQPWYPVLLEMTSDIVRSIPPGADHLTDATGKSHPLAKTLLLAAWRLCGDVTKCVAARMTWSVLSWQELERPRTVLTSPHRTLGSVGIAQGILIPCLRI